MRVFDTSTIVRGLGSENKPIAVIEPGETIRVETIDCYGGFIGRDGIERPHQSGANPVTGTFFVNGAEEGDTLEVTIHKIHLPEYGIMCLRKNVGGLKNVVEYKDPRILPIEEGGFTNLDGVRLPLAPMIGVIGVAPRQGFIDTDTPGAHGGNMDDRRIGEGAKVYFPVHHAGALFALGDLHAQMGDGEVAICGMEIAGAVELSFRVIKGVQEEWPFVLRDKSWSVNCSAETLDKAAELARYALHGFIMRRAGISAHNAALLSSLVCDLSVCQLVDPLVTVRMALRPNILDIEF